MTAGQIKAAAFVDELSKESASLLSRIGQWTGRNPKSTGAAITGGLGAYGFAKHGPWGAGGRSKGEAKAYQSVQKLEDQDQQDPQVQEELRRALTNQRKAARGAEGAGGWLGAAGLGGAAIHASRRLFDSPMIKDDMGTVTTYGDLKALHSDLTNQLGYDIPVSALPEGQFEDALSIPKGGFLPKFLRKWEAGKHVPAFAARNMSDLKWHLDQLKVEDPELYEEFMHNNPIDIGASNLAASKKDALQALETGHVMAPMKAGPHFTAHEFGHAMFGNSTLGKLTHMARTPTAYAGGLAALTAATATDPDSTASKLSPLMAAAGVAPILGEEAMASINAIKAMKRTGFSPQQLSMGKKQLGRAFGTYALGLGLPSIAAPYIIRKVKQYNQGRRERQGIESPGQLQQRINSLPQATGD